MARFLFVFFDMFYYYRNLGKTKSIMSNSSTNSDSLTTSDFDKPTLPSGLNILTILTFIGCGLQVIGVILGFVNAQKAYDEKDKMMERVNSGEMPSWARSMMPNMDHYEEMLTKNLENKIPMLIIGLAAIALCFYGALQMRKLKKQGFTIYLIGQVLPFISTALFVGLFMFAGIGFAIQTAITVLFILLYLTQRKHLVY
jgi:hypothetical protein